MPENQYIDTLLRDFAEDIAAYRINQPIETIFIGGGTPSLFSPSSINRLLSGINQQLNFAKNIEITLEANPGTFESQKFAEFRALGINRLSIGIQSFNDPMLKKLGRVHSSHEAILAAEIAHQAGFENFNLDLMYGLPDANIELSKNDINTAISLLPKHISLYQLSLEPNTYFYKFPPQLPSDELIFQTQLACQEQLALHGFIQYEISAYSKAGYNCRHNINYWQFGDYLGIGAGAHGKITLTAPDQILRYAKPKSPEHYQLQPTPETSVVALADIPVEYLMNQLRLKSGFNLNAYQARTGLSSATLEPGLTACLKAGLLIENAQHYHCSAKGWDFLDSILAKFLP
jgi:oxygen-independent coproporphyrinogen-3 oxidase